MLFLAIFPCKIFDSMYFRPTSGYHIIHRLMMPITLIIAEDDKVLDAPPDRRQYCDGRVCETPPARLDEHIGSY